MHINTTQWRTYKLRIFKRIVLQVLKSLNNKLIRIKYENYKWQLRYTYADDIKMKWKKRDV